MYVFSRVRTCWGIAIAMTVAAGVSMAQDPESSRGRPQANQTAAFIGISVEDVPPPVAFHLGDLLPEGQGVLVVAVGKDSPAQKGGIREHDILLTYDEQKLFTAEQLIRLVHSDKPSREVKVTLLRRGKVETATFTLGERPVPARTEPGIRTTRSRLWGWLPPGRRRTESAQTAWDSFDSMTLKKLDNDRFQASIKYKDKDGKMETREFEGSRDEIQKKIEADKDMTQQERGHLLRSLDLGSGNEPAWPTPEDLDF